MKTEKSKQIPVLYTKIGDMDIQSILDTGFIYKYEMTTYIHSHSYYELFTAVEGTLCIESPEGLQIHVSAGTLCLIPPNFYHRTFSLETSCAKLAIRFHYSRNAENTDESVYNTCHTFLSNCHIPVTLNDCLDICKQIQEMQNEMTNPRFASKTCMTLLLSQIYIQIFRYLTEEKIIPTTVPAPDTFDWELRQLQIDEYLNLHFNEAITEDDMSGYFNVSKRHLNRILQKIYNMSFREILINKRMNEALHLLVSTEYSIETIANMVGYTSVSGFYTAFHNKYHMTAGQYRKVFSKNNAASENKTSRD